MTKLNHLVFVAVLFLIAIAIAFSFFRKSKN